MVVLGDKETLIISGGTVAELLAEQPIESTTVHVYVALERPVVASSVTPAILPGAHK
jgi:hypothetical protein